MKPLEVDYTCLADLRACPRFYYNRYELGIVPIDRPPPIALEFGIAMHAAVEALCIYGLEAALSKFDELYTTQYETHGWEDTLRTPYMGRVLIYAYHQKWGQIKYLHLEIGAAVQVDEVLYYGRIDRVNDDEFHTVTDIKTTSGLLWLPLPRLNWQMIGYAHMTRELTGVEPKQVAIDGLVIPRLSKKIEVPPPEEEYALKIHDNLHLRTAQLHQRDYDEWHRWLKWSVFKINLCRDTGEWPMEAPTSCNRYNRVCDYAILCQAQDADQEQRLIENLYEVSRWHPFSEG